MRTKPVSHQYGVPTKELAGAARAAEPKSAVEEKKNCYKREMAKRKILSILMVLVRPVSKLMVSKPT